MVWVGDMIPRPVVTRLAVPLGLYSLSQRTIFSFHTKPLRLVMCRSLWLYRERGRALEEEGWGGWMTPITRRNRAKMTVPADIEAPQSLYGMVGMDEP